MQHNKTNKQDWELKAERAIKCILDLEHLSENSEDMFDEWLNDNNETYSEEEYREYVGDYASSLRKELVEKLNEVLSEFDTMAHDIIQ